jgi:hypothetical protein
MLLELVQDSNEIVWFLLRITILIIPYQYWCCKKLKKCTVPVPHEGKMIGHTLVMQPSFFLYSVS